MGSCYGQRMYCTTEGKFLLTIGEYCTDEPPAATWRRKQIVEDLTQAAWRLTYACTLQHKELDRPPPRTKN